MQLSSVDPQKYCHRPETLGVAVVGLNSSALIKKNVQNKIAIVGIPDDRGIGHNYGHVGAQKGPEFFRQSFYKLYDAHLSTGSLLSTHVVDCGDVILANEIAQTHDNLSEVVSALLKAEASAVIVVGGGHDFSFGSFHGHANALGGIIPVINFDAHFDLRPVVDKKVNSGTPFFRIVEILNKHVLAGEAILEIGIQRERNPQSLFEYAANHKIKTVEYLAIHDKWIEMSQNKEIAPHAHVLNHLDRCTQLGWIKESGSLHFSLDLDVFSSSIAPGTSGATPFGCQLSALGSTICYMGRSQACKVFDLAELCPSRDVNDQTSRLAAGLVFQFILARVDAGRV